MAKQIINNLESAATVRKKINDNFTELYTQKVPKDHSSQSNEYGVATDELFGHIKVSSGNGLNINEGALSLGLASDTVPGSVQFATSIDSGFNNRAVTAAQVKTIKTTLTNLQNSTSPKNHAANNTTYGVASTSMFGHVKIVSSNGLNINNGVLSINNATTSQVGTVQLVDSLSNQSTTTALTAKQGYILDQKKPDVFSGSTAPSNSIGRNGDIYFLIG